MPRIDFPDLPDHGRLWVFPIDRQLSTDEANRCLGVVDDFLAEWAAHGQPLRSARDLLAGRFLLVGVDVDAEAPSGCSIDALMRRLRELGSEIGADLVDHAPVWYRSGDEIRAVSRQQFKALAEDGTVSAETSIFDTTLTRVGQFRAGGLERPARDSWHGRAFFRTAGRSA